MQFNNTTLSIMSLNLKFQRIPEEGEATLKETKFFSKKGKYCILNRRDLKEQG